MPMLPVDQDPGWAGPRPQTFGQWAGKRIGELALDMHYRGVFAADYFIGLNVGADWHPRLINSFETWAGVSVQGLTVQARHDYLVAHYQPQ